ncbi:hypothetical protein FP2506_04776 [Fulvimarina pelagi HTCC2506]|uniref:Uncharacterized protein n=2 Tax=Fulvimarina pelagi TaxID=217511 RepID=Q0FZS7_9HYPH|nr:DUF6105 family protein [Fulvimarina pelagi]EAU40514.1 hypothetical protein FP2506_04776 [Fulvimarina pelagi HTCC2506]BAT31539.1 hypothetical protein [Fulvimarina pelagi]
MRAFFLYWFLPLAGFWGWFFAARFDVGYVVFSREVYDKTFAVYEALLGMDADAIAWLMAEAIVFDSFILLAIIAFRRRTKIAAFIREWRNPAGEGSDRLQERYDSIAYGSGARAPGKVREAV